MADPEIIEEVAGAITEAPQEAVAHRDDVHNDVAAAIASLKAPAEPVTIEGTAEVISERPRAADGKFTPKEAAPEAAAVPDPKLPTAEAQAKVSSPAPKLDAALPAGWSADGKTALATLSEALPTLPPAVQAAVRAIQVAANEREQAMAQGGQQWSEQKRRYEAVLSPIAQESQRRGLSVEEGAQRLMDGQRFLETQPAQAILWLAQKNGIDLADLASNPPAFQQQARPDPAFVQVSQSVSTLEQRLQQIEFGNNLTVAQQFAASKPHYADVEEKLPDFIREVQKLDPSLTGLALLEKAYDRAVWLNPDVRAKVQAAERAEAEKTRVATVQAKASQASRAVVSVKGSSAAATPPRQAPASSGDTYDDVRQAIHQLRAG